MAIDLEEGGSRQPVHELIDLDRQLAFAGDEVAVDLPGFSLPRMTRRLQSHHLALACQRHDLMRSHGVEADGLALAMQAAAQPVVERRRMDGDRRMAVDLANAPQGFGQDPLLRFDLHVQPKRGPVAATALLGDRTRSRPPKATGTDQAYDFPSRKSLL